MRDRWTNNKYTEMMSTWMPRLAEKNSQDEEKLLRATVNIKSPSIYFIDQQN
jgi:hypothetical protein